MELATEAGYLVCMTGKPTSIRAFLTGLPADRRETVEAIRRVILDNLDDSYEEGLQYGTLAYYVPHRVYAKGYHCDPKQPVPFASLATQKSHLALHLMFLYGNPQLTLWFQKEWAKTGKRLNMGKSCLRFKKLDDLPLELIGKAIRSVPARDYLAQYEAALSGNKAGRAELGRSSEEVAEKRSGQRKLPKANPTAESASSRGSKRKASQARGGAQSSGNHKTARIKKVSGKRAESSH